MPRWRSPRPTATSGPGWSRRWPGGSAISTSPRRRRPRPSRPRSNGGRRRRAAQSCAWLTLTANRKAIDRSGARASATTSKRRPRCCTTSGPTRSAGAIEDERLRLIFTCCHPALAIEARVALTLRLVGGLTVPEIARAFLVPEATMGRRITRAKDKIKAARIPYRVPSAADLPVRLSGVLAVLFLVFNEGYLATGARHPSGAARPHRRGDPAHPSAPGAAARRRRGDRPARADAAHRCPACRP